MEQEIYMIARRCRLQSLEKGNDHLCSEKMALKQLNDEILTRASLEASSKRKYIEL